MKRRDTFAQDLLQAVALALATCAPARLPAQEANQPAPLYHIYAGNTHSHTSYTWSHGQQWDNPQHLVVTGSTDAPGPNNVLKPDWKKFQGPPAKHFAIAKSMGYDFYVSSDHSQEAAFQPVSPTNAAWQDTKAAAAAATDSHFIGLAGYEHSENNGPGGKGHLNVINSAEYLNALAPGVDLPYLYKWLKTVPSNGDGPVVASFNHPGPQQYADWANRDSQITDIITMLEVVNSDKSIHYQGFINALDKGWKVSPIAGADNHGLPNMAKNRSKARTFVLATNLSKDALLEAMKHRRTYASLDGNLQCRYTVNGRAMGSTLDKPSVLRFDILIEDPDAANPRDRITKIDIVKDGGAVALEYQSTPGYAVRWTPSIEDSTSRYFFVRVWTAGGGEAAGADPARPMAWLAPVWTGR